MSPDDERASALHYTAERTRFYGLISPKDVSIQTVNNALLTARTFPSDRTFLGSVYDATGSQIRSVLRFNPRDIEPVDPRSIRRNDLRYRPAQTFDAGIYAGNLFQVAGHFLTESLARLWLNASLAGADHLASIPIFFHRWVNDIQTFHPFDNELYAAILTAIGVRRDQIVFLDHNVLVRRLLLPEPVFRYHVSTNVQFNVVFDRIVENLWAIEVAGRPLPSSIYLSRARWAHNRRIENELDLEALMLSLGVTPVYPELLTPAELISVLSRSNLVLASDGSHAHLVAFCRPGTKVVVLDTRTVPTQSAIEALRRHRSVHIPIFLLDYYDEQMRVVTRLSELKALCATIISHLP